MNLRLMITLEIQCLRAVLSNTVATNQVNLFKLVKSKQNLKFSSSVTLAVFQGCSYYVWLVTTMLDSTDRERFYHWWKLCWTGLEDCYSVLMAPDCHPFISCPFLWFLCLFSCQLSLTLPSSNLLFVVFNSIHQICDCCCS